MHFSDYIKPHKGEVMTVNEFENYNLKSQKWERRAKENIFELRHIKSSEKNHFLKKLKQHHHLVTLLDDLYYDYWTDLENIEYFSLPDRENFEECIHIKKGLDKYLDNIYAIQKKLLKSHESIGGYYSLLMAREVLREGHIPEDYKEFEKD